MAQEVAHQPVDKVSQAFCHPCEMPKVLSIVEHDPVLGNTVALRCPGCHEFAQWLMLEQALNHSFAHLPA